MKKLFFTAFMILTATQMYGQTKLIETVPAPPPGFGAVIIPYSKFQISNGLTLIVTEDHSDPIVHVDVTYHVGSAREEIGKSGFAHFFEHMMFQGSKHVADEEHFKIVTKAGGTMNGTTNRDRTNYFETVPKNYLETALWLEADRMGFLLDAVTQQKFEIQRATVKNEKGQNYENRPYGMVGEIASKSFYPFAHPYSWPTIGYLKDLNSVGVEDLKKFFTRWYGPNNAVLTVGGDVRTDEVVKLVEKYFGPIPKGPEVKKVDPEYFYLDKDRYISMEDNIRFPMLRVMYPSVANFHQDEAPLDILAEILGQGKGSILYKNFVKTKKALQASANNPCTELAGEFTFTILAYPGTKLSDMKKLLDSSINEFLTRGITDEDLEKAKAKRLSEAIFGLESISGKVSQLAFYETFLGNPNFVGADIARYENVTKADVIRAFENYIKNAHPLIVSVYPKGQKNLVAAADNYKPDFDSSKAKHENYDTIKTRKVVDNFDRSKHPTPGPSPIVKVPPYDKLTMPNKMNIIVTPNHEVPDVYVQFNLKAGQIKEPKGKEGIAYLLSRMFQESTMGMSAEQLQNEIEKLGSDISVYTTDENIVFSVMSLKNKLPATLNLVNEMMMHPKFDKEEFERTKKQQLELLANQAVQADAMADVTFAKLLYSEDHPLGSAVYGTIPSVTSITENDLMMYYRKNLSALNMNVIVSGDIDKSELEHLMMPFMQIPPMPTEELKLPETPKIEKTKIYLVNKDNAPQSELRVGYLALPYDATGEFYKANVMNYILGGAFNSRINLNLRENKGWTYGARSYFTGSHIPGPFEVSTGVIAKATDSALIEILKEIKNYRDKGITKEELEFTKKSILEREALKYETNNQKARFVERILEYNLDNNFVDESVNILKGLKRKDIKALAQKYLPIDNMVIVVVGDAKTWKAPLAKLGYDVVDVTSFDQSMNK